MKSKNFYLSIVAILFVIFAFGFSESLIAQETPSVSEVDRVRIAEAFRLGKKFFGKVWKDWSKTPFAVLLVAPENEFLIGHPSPSKDFAEIGYDKLLKNKVYWRKRTFDPRFLATFPAIKGSAFPTIVVGQAENTQVKTSTPWIVTLLHEHFHQFQDSQPNAYQDALALGLSGGDENGMWMLNYPFPYADKKINEDFANLARQLAKALETNDRASFEKEFDVYVKLRKTFSDSLKPNDYKYLSFQLWKEGTARYTEIQIAKLAAKNYKPNKKFTKLKDYKPYAEFAAELEKRTVGALKNISLEETRREVVYPFGAGEALLLDKAGIDWKSNYFNDKFNLDKNFYVEK